MFGDKERQFWASEVQKRLNERKEWINSKQALSYELGIMPSTTNILLRTITDKATLATTIPIALMLDIDLYELARGLELDEPVLRALEDKSKRKYFPNYIKGHGLTEDETDEKYQAIETLLRELPPEKQERARDMIEMVIRNVK